MSFMRNNRALNGAASPDKTASAEASAQRTARQLDPNGPIPPTGEDLRFSPKMLTCAQINEQHYQGGLQGEGPYATSYEEHILSLGTNPYPTGNGRDLKSR